MTAIALIVLLGLAGLLLLIGALRRLRRRRFLGGLLGSVSGIVLILAAAMAALLAANLHGYRRLAAEQPAGELQFTARGPREFNALLTYSDGRHDTFELAGDEWQVDARVLKWRVFANLLGFDAIYRLERIGGRYSRIEDERALPRTVYSLNPRDAVDLWDLARLYHSWVPGLDALYGSATYLPMADGALYAVSVSQSGLVARPLNQAAQDAVGRWH